MRHETPWRLAACLPIEQSTCLYAIKKYEELSVTLRCDAVQHPRSGVLRFDLAPVIADIIGSHCPRTHARRDFLRACFQEDWKEVHAMVEGMLAEPWYLRGYQAVPLREFLTML